ncbi:MAG: hypothetical protein OHK0046_45290 [Anaerolineae bacterium]
MDDLKGMSFYSCNVNYSLERCYRLRPDLSTYAEPPDDPRLICRAAARTKEWTHACNGTAIRKVNSEMSRDSRSAGDWHGECTTGLGTG